MTNNDHDRFEELACLRAYGELDAAEEPALEAHLADCSACRRFVAELDGGLALLVAREQRVAARELPLDWRAGLEARVRRPRARRLAPVLTFAAGLAAGLLVALLAGWRGEAGSGPAPAGGGQDPIVASNAAPARAPLEFDAPPPRTTSRGQGALLAMIRAR